MIALRHSAPAPTPPSHFHPLPLIAALLSVMRRRSHNTSAKPDPEWEKDAPMNGLS